MQKNDSEASFDVAYNGSTSENGYDKDAHIMKLILQKHEAKKRISQLEGIIAQLEERLTSRGGHGGGAFTGESAHAAPSLTDTGTAVAATYGAGVDRNASDEGVDRPISAPAAVAATNTVSDSNKRLTRFKSVDESLEQMNRMMYSSPAATTESGRFKQPQEFRGSVEELFAWNEQLIQLVEKLESQILQLEADARSQLLLVMNEMRVLADENDAIRMENESLKSRIADDVIQKRQTYRIEMASKKAAIATQVRKAGQARLEALEGTLMEAHDDLYHIQRWDAAVSAVRDVCFVFHYVSNLTFPLAGIEEIVMNVYTEALLQTMRKHQGYRVASYRGMEVFAFQVPLQCLHFCRDTHEQLTRLQWPEKAQEVAHFKTLAEYGTILFRGPRVHTCIYACNPGAEVDPMSGRSLYYGPEVRQAITAAIASAPPGEIVVNDLWGSLLCRQARRETNSHEPSREDVVSIRDLLGGNWSVVGLSGTRGIIASIVPATLVGRRGLPPYSLRPTPATPWVELDEETFISSLLRAMKGIQTDAGGKKAKLVRFVAAGEGPGGPSSTSNRQQGDEATKRLEYYALEAENKRITELYHKTEQICSVWERHIMASEDRLETSKRKPLDPSETVYVCTVDVGDESVWRRLVQPNTTDTEFDEIRANLQGCVHVPAKNFYGFLMNGNNTDIFTYVFREVEQALAFVSDVYIKTNRLGTRVSRGDHMLLRAGISEGTMSTIYRNVENGILKCSGPVIRLSGTLCDLAQSGEILAMEDVISAFYASNENLLDKQYNIVKQKGHFLNEFDAPAVVHSILPKPFAFRRPLLIGADNKDGRKSTRSATAALMVQQRQFPREAVDNLLVQTRERVERSEGARMLREDTYETQFAAAALGNPWMLTAQKACRTLEQIKEENERAVMEAAHTATNGANRASGDAGDPLGNASRQNPPPSLPIPPPPLQPNVPLVFMLIDMAGYNQLQRELSNKNLVKEIMGHFNNIVQTVMRELMGTVVKSNGVSAYLAVFRDCGAALDAAIAVQQRMLAVAWPAELRTVEPTLFVRDVKSPARTVLFEGPRPQVTLHCSTDYAYKSIKATDQAPRDGDSASNAAEDEESDVGNDSGHGNGGVTGFSNIHVYGPAVEELAVLAKTTFGGEIRLSKSFLTYVGSSSSGRGALEQLIMVIVSLHAAGRAVALDSVGTPGAVSLPAGSAIPLLDISTSNSAFPFQRQGSTSNSFRLSSSTGSTGRQKTAGGGGGAKNSPDDDNKAHIGCKNNPTKLFDAECICAVPKKVEGRLQLWNLSSSASSPVTTASAITTAAALLPSAKKGDTSGSSAEQPQSTTGARQTSLDSLPNSRSLRASGAANATGSLSGSGTYNNRDADAAPGSSPPVLEAARQSGASPATPLNVGKRFAPPQPPPLNTTTIGWITDSSCCNTAMLPRAQVGIWERQRQWQMRAVNNNSNNNDSGEDTNDNSPNGAATGTFMSILEAVHPEAVEIQDVLQRVVTLFPVFTSAANRANRSAGGSRKSKKANVSAPLNSPLSQAEEEEQARYEAFMKVTKQLVTLIVNAFRIVNERKKTPALPKDIDTIREKSLNLIASNAPMQPQGAGKGGASPPSNATSGANTPAVTLPSIPVTPKLTGGIPPPPPPSITCPPEAAVGSNSAGIGISEDLERFMTKKTKYSKDPTVAATQYLGEVAKYTHLKLLVQVHEANLAAIQRSIQSEPTNSAIALSPSNNARLPGGKGTAALPTPPQISQMRGRK